MNLANDSFLEGRIKDIESNSREKRGNQVEYRERFQKYLPSGFQPLDFQVGVGDQLLRSENVILLAPTGSGKTLTALVPFVHAKMEGKVFADRVIYALPMRSLARSLYEAAKKQFENRDPKKGPIISVTLQVGDQPDDPFFEGDIIFCTIDQLLSSFLNIPVSLSDRVANIPAGALVGALIVFDEFHLLETQRSLATTVELTNYLRGLSQFLLMTATAPKVFVERLARDISAKVIIVSDEELEQIPSQIGKQRTYQWVDEQLTAAAVIQRHISSSLVVVNSVRRAQELYISLMPLTNQGNIPLKLLHSRFLAKDRSATESFLMSNFSNPSYKAWRDGKAEKPFGILVATQVVEVGLDVSFDVLHTELAPANALVQRAGRCARFPHHNNGRVYVYCPERDAAGNYKLGPYRYQPEIIQRTEEALRDEPTQPVDFRWERIFIDKVHSEADLKGYEKRPTVWKDIEQALRGDRSKIRDLVRDANSLSVIIHPTPQDLDLRRGVDVFSIPITTLFGGVKDTTLLEKPGAVKFISVDDTGEVVWETVKSVKEAVYKTLIALSPDIASYDSKIGLLLGQTGDFISAYSQTNKGRKDFERYSYVKETFSDHGKRTAMQMDKLLSKQATGVARIANRLEIEFSELLQILKTIALIHDAGKLSEAWQARAWKWQEKWKGDTRGGFLAHTDFDAHDFNQIEDYRRQITVSHAMEGVHCLTKYLLSTLEKIMEDEELACKLAICFGLAIGRHHSGFTDNLDTSFAFSAAAWRELANLLDCSVNQVRHDSIPSRDLGSRLFGEISGRDETDMLAMVSYWFAVRNLRLADQLATKSARKEGEHEG